MRIVKLAKNFAFGKIEKILVPSQTGLNRIALYSGSAGGCAFRHIAYEAELCAKEQRVRDNLRAHWRPGKCGFAAYYGGKAEG